jgi:restriction endonuclease Mrr
MMQYCPSPASRLHVLCPPMPGPVVAGRRDILDELNARVILIDGLMLARLMVEHNIGAQDDETFVLKKIDEDFFEQS